MRRGDTIWELVRQASETLPEPFSRAALISWISKRRPDAQLSSIGAHIHVAIAETPNRSSHQLGSRPPLLSRVDRGLYRRYRPGTDAVQPTTAATTVPADKTMAVVQPAETLEGRIILVGCSRTKASSAAPARDLFRGHGFELARDYAGRAGGPWFVLSAKFGLLHPDDVVGPYDVYLP